MTDSNNNNSTISDNAERTEALNPNSSFIVQAPAGSGKTELLTRRLLKLLSMVNRPEDILTVTFTKKAAREMKNRVLDTLRNVSADNNLNDEKSILAKGVIEKDRAEGWNLLENPERLNIGTIDSFCSRIATQMPLLSEIGSLRTITDTTTPLYNRAAKHLIMKIDDDSLIGKEIRFALNHMDNSTERLVRHMVDILTKRDQWTRHINNREAKPTKEKLEESLRSLIERALNKLEQLFPDNLKEQILASAQWAAKNIDGGKPNAYPITELAKSDRFPTNKINDIKLWQYIANFLLTGNGNWRNAKGVNKSIGFPTNKEGIGKEEKEAFQEILETLRPNIALQDSLNKTKQIPQQPTYSNKQWEVLNSILSLLPYLETELKEVFNEERKIDFIGMSEGAIDALGTDELPTEMLLNLDMQLQHILVDEYQDTSRTHLTLIKKLTLGWEEGDGRTLFIVGDPMQSIYLFREAEVGLFIDAWDNGIGNINLTPIRLKTNFRSGKPIVDWINKAFTPRFPIKSNASLGIVEYAPSIPCDNHSEGKVTTRIWAQKSDQEEAEKTLDIIRIIRSASEDEEIAILVKSRNHLKEIIPALKREGIAYSAQKIDKLPEKQIIRDIGALLKAVINPFDKISWLSIMRAPWCGLTLDEINKLTYDRPNDPIWQIITEEKENIRGRLPEKKRGNLLRLTEGMKQALKVRGRIPISNIVERLWLSIGGAACTREDELNNANTLFALMSKATEGGNIIDMETFDFMIGKLYTTPSDNEERRLKIMTIHESKGLEFDHVIILGIGKSPRPNSKELFVWLEDEGALALAPIGGIETEKNDPIYSFLNGIRLEKEKHERERLIYVATTRAKKGLYLFGNAKYNKDGIGTPKDTSLLSSIWDNIGSEQPPVIASMPQESKDRPTPKLKRLNIGYTPPAPPKSLIEKTKKEIAPSVIDSTKNSLSRGNKVAKNIGTIIHRYLKRISDEGVDKWDEERIGAEKEILISLHKELGTPAKDINNSADKSIEILKTTISDNRGRWVLGEKKEASSEFPISGLHNGTLIHGVIDRTFIDKNETRYIIDYKTSQPNGKELENFLKDKKEEHAAQLLVYSELLRLTGEKRIIKNALFFPAIAGWIEWNPFN